MQSSSSETLAAPVLSRFLRRSQLPAPSALPVCSRVLARRKVMRWKFPNRLFLLQFRIPNTFGCVALTNVMNVVRGASGAQFSAERRTLASEGRRCHVQAEQAEAAEIAGAAADVP
ncbi:unnamed protein product [Coccothraustes coccothraustes]